MKTFVQIGERTFETEIVERAGRLLVLLDGEPCDVTYTEADGDGQVTVIPRKGGLDVPRDDGGKPTVIANVAISVARDLEGTA